MKRTVLLPWLCNATFVINQVSIMKLCTSGLCNCPIISFHTLYQCHIFFITIALQYLLISSWKTPMFFLKTPLLLLMCYFPVNFKFILLNSILFPDKTHASILNWITSKFYTNLWRIEIFILLKRTHVMDWFVSPQTQA